MRTLILLTSCFALAACGESTSVDADGDGTITNEEVLAATADIASPKAGRWEVSSEIREIRIPGMPAGMEDMARGMFSDMFASTNYCLTPQQAEQDPEALWKETQGDCSWESFEMTDDRVDAKAVCKGPDGSQSTMTMSGTHTPTSYSADNEMTLSSSQGDGFVKVHVEGRHVGDCDGSEIG